MPGQKLTKGKEMVQTLTNTQIIVLIGDCYTCSTPVYAPSIIERKAREKGAGWYCVNGHATVFSETTTKENERLKRELAGAQEFANGMSSRLTEARKTHEVAMKKIGGRLGAATKKLNRVANGVCPQCKRSFANLQKHMQSKHFHAMPDIS